MASRTSDNQFVNEEDGLSEFDEESTIYSKPALVTSSAPPPALHERNPLEFTVIIAGGTALAFNAGFVNGTTYLLCNTPVSHVTGTTTKAALTAGAGDWEDMAINLALIASFIAGSAITGSMMPHPSFHLGKEYGPLFLVGSLLFFLADVSLNYAPEPKLYLYFSAMACGLQNAMTTRYSGNIIRTTHMSGTATDIGLVFGRMMMGEFKELWKLYLLVPMFIGFFLGGIVSVQAVKHFGRFTTLANVAVFFSIGLAYSAVVAYYQKIPIWKAYLGNKLKATVKKVKSVAESMKMQTVHHDGKKHNERSGYTAVEDDKFNEEEEDI